MNTCRATALLALAALAAAGCSRPAAPQQAATTSSPASSAKSEKEQTQEAVSSVCDVFASTARELAKAEKQFVHEVPSGTPLSDPQAAPKADALAKKFRDGAAKIDASITPKVTDSLAENLRSYTAIVRKFAELLVNRGSDADFDELSAAVGGAANDVKPACGIKK